MNISLSTYDHHHSPEQLIDLVSSINSQTKIVDYGQLLPTLSAEAITLKRLMRQTFGHVICILQVGVNTEHFDVSILDMAPEEVPLDQELLGTRCDALVDSKEKGTIVLKHPRVDGRCCGGWKTQSR